MYISRKNIDPNYIHRENFEVEYEYITNPIDKASATGELTRTDEINETRWAIIYTPVGNDSVTLSIFFRGISVHKVNYKLVVKSFKDGVDIAIFEGVHGFSKSSNNRTFTLKNVSDNFVDSENKIHMLLHLKSAYSIPSWFKNTRRELGSVGLENQASTCYLNALLQALYNIPYFRKLVYNLSPEETSSFVELQKLFLFLQKADVSPSTKKLTQAFKWDESSKFMQQDIFEFFHLFLEYLCDHFKGSGMEEEFKDMFFGKTRQYTISSVAGESSEHESDFSVFHLNFEEGDSVFSALQRMAEEKVVDTGDENVKKSLKDRFSKLPIILTIALVFPYGSHNSITFRKELDLSGFVTDDFDEEITKQYSLISVVVYYNIGPYGHYKVICKNEKGKWISFNDDCIDEISEESVLNESHSFGFFYVRKDQYERIMNPVEDADIPQNLLSFFENWRLSCLDKDAIKVEAYSEEDYKGDNIFDLFLKKQFKSRVSPVFLNSSAYKDTRASVCKVLLPSAKIDDISIFRLDDSGYPCAKLEMTSKISYQKLLYVNGSFEQTQPFFVYRLNSETNSAEYQQFLVLDKSNKFSILKDKNIATDKDIIYVSKLGSMKFVDFDSDVSSSSGIILIVTDEGNPTKESRLYSQFIEFLKTLHRVELHNHENVKDSPICIRLREDETLDSLVNNIRSRLNRNDDYSVYISYEDGGKLIFLSESQEGNVLSNTLKGRKCFFHIKEGIKQEESSNHRFLNIDIYNDNFKVVRTHLFFVDDYTKASSLLDEVYKLDNIPIGQYRLLQIKNHSIVTCNPEDIIDKDCICRIELIPENQQIPKLVNVCFTKSDDDPLNNLYGAPFIFRLKCGEKGQDTIIRLNSYGKFSTSRSRFTYSYINDAGKISRIEPDTILYNEVDFNNKSTIIAKLETCSMRRSQSGIIIN